MDWAKNFVLRAGAKDPSNTQKRVLAGGQMHLSIRRKYHAENKHTQAASFAGTGYGAGAGNGAVADPGSEGCELHHNSHRERIDVYHHLDRCHDIYGKL
jgi:hypothetical protein